MTFIAANVLKLNDRVITTASYATLIEYLQENYPDGFSQDVDIYVNERKIAVEDYDIRLYEDDVIVLMFRPAVAAALGITNVWLALAVNLAASYAISYVVGKIFAPSTPALQSSSSLRNSRGKASSVYSLNAQQNEAKKGEVIPIIYGKVRTYPALISPPYYRYENNEENLYQLMCIGQGKYDIEKMLISDTDTQEIQTDFFRYEKLEYNDFSVPANMAAKINDSNYHSLVKTIPDVENLELRGTPQNTSMVMRFENSTITFYPYANGDEPDLSSLIAGSTIDINNTVSNNGTYTVDTVVGLVVTVVAYTFVTEPTDNKSFTGFYSDPDGAKSFEVDTNRFYILDSAFDDIAADYYIVNPLDLGIDNIFTISGANAGVEFQASSEYSVGQGNTVSPTGGTYTYPAPLVDETVTSGTVTATYVAKVYSATFTTSYGAFLYNKSHIGFEVDYVYVGGIYNTDGSGNFTDRTTEFEIKYDEAGIPATQIVSTTDRDNTPIRNTYKHIYSVPQSTANIRLKRITGEPTSINSADKMYIRSIKFIHAEPDYVPLGDITLLWCKVRATNAITQAGQFSINTWVTRNDVANDMASVLTDLYTNTTYGGRLPLSELDFPVTTDVVNGAIDTKMTLYDAMQMAAKSNRYNVYPVGGDVKLRKDEAQGIRTALYNETNMLKDTLKISYLFTEADENDSVKVRYRDSTEFKEQTAIYPANGIFPLEVDLWGVTSQTVALEMATYLFLQDRTRRKTVEFVTDIQGLIPQFLDRIGISHSLPKWGIGGQIVAVDGDTITLDCDFGTAANIWVCDDTYDCNEIFREECGDVVVYDNIIFRGDNGAVSGAYSFTPVGTRTILLDTAAPLWLNTNESHDNTFFSIGTAQNIVKDYVVVKIEPNTDTSVKITATNYDDSIYNYPSGNILTQASDAIVTEASDNIQHEG